MIKMSEVDLDTVLLNQPVAREGVLQYPEYGVAKLKKWEDLKSNIGRRVPVLDEHPSMENGNHGLFSGKEKVLGTAVIKACPHGDKNLCADIHLTNGSVIKRGYSIGYPYKMVKEKGTHDGVPYDEIQSNLLIDHLALTDEPRDRQALQIAGDARITFSPLGITVNNDSSVSEQKGIDINMVGYDSHVIATDALENIPQERIEEIKRKLAQDNPRIDRVELNVRASLMAKNEMEIKQVEPKVSPNKKEDMDQEEEEEEEEKNSSDSLGKTREQLIAENARLKAEATNRDSVDKRISALEKQLKVAQDSAKTYQDLYQAEITKNTENTVNILVKEHGFDSKSFKSKSADFIEGCLFGARSVGGKIQGDRDSGNQTERDSNEEIPLLDINMFQFDSDSQKMVLRPEYAHMQKYVDGGKV